MALASEKQPALIEWLDECPDAAELSYSLLYPKQVCTFFFAYFDVHATNGNRVNSNTRDVSYILSERVPSLLTNVVIIVC